MPLLERLQLLGRGAAPEAWTGRYRTRQKGRSLEYAGFREYVPGDDPRTLDWRALARLDRPFVREYTAERERVVTLLVDGSGSMAAGQRVATALQLAAALGYCALHHGDRLQVTLLRGPEARVLGDGRGRAARHRLALALAAAEEAMGEGEPVTTALLAALQHWQRGTFPGTNPAAWPAAARGEAASPASRPVQGPGSSPAAGVPETSAAAVPGTSSPAPANRRPAPRAARTRRRGLAILLSDLLDPASAGARSYLHQVAALLASAGQGAVVHLLDPQEVAPPPGEWTLVDAETGAALEVTVDRWLLERYRQTVARWLEDWRSACHAHGVVYVPVPAPSPPRALIADHLVPAGLMG